MRKIYVCHPYRDNPPENVKAVRDICRRIALENCLPIAPHLHLPQFISEEFERPLALALCLELLALCDEVRVYSGRITDGMKLEIARAIELNIPTIFIDEEVMA